MSLALNVITGILAGKDTERLIAEELERLRSEKKCKRADETCRECIVCEGSNYIPIPAGVVCDCNGTGCSNEEHREEDDDGEDERCRHGVVLGGYCDQCRLEEEEDGIDAAERLS